MFHYIEIFLFQESPWTALTVCVVLIDYANENHATSGIILADVALYLTKVFQMPKLSSSEPTR